MLFSSIDLLFIICCFFKQKTAYEMRISDWSSDVCSSDLADAAARDRALQRLLPKPGSCRPVVKLRPGHHAIAFPLSRSASRLQTKRSPGRCSNTCRGSQITLCYRVLLVNVVSFNRLRGTFETASQFAWRSMNAGMSSISSSAWLGRTRSLGLRAPDRQGAG